ncbi:MULTISPECIES: transposase domain-containing protein [unclassified Bradyrhizobium]|uniref:transposase domain-containing protein n=1 Tax=unclassified Bradyrhizobium TaxID=2631580 RepID=UPI001FF773B9|nr:MULTISPECIES: transposase domain-containing protein [unclassified Bradyrhizobium]
MAFGCMVARAAHPVDFLVIDDCHEVGAENWALLASIVATCKLNDVNPAAYIAETLEAIIDGHPDSRIEDLMPWRFRKTSSQHQ